MYTQLRHDLYVKLIYRIEALFEYVLVASDIQSDHVFRNGFTGVMHDSFPNRFCTFQCVLSLLRYDMLCQSIALYSVSSMQA